MASDTGPPLQRNVSGSAQYGRAAAAKLIGAQLHAAGSAPPAETRGSSNVVAKRTHLPLSCALGNRRSGREPSSVRDARYRKGSIDIEQGYV
jgi:hypothetical protein